MYVYTDLQLYFTNAISIIKNNLVAQELKKHYVKSCISDVQVKLLILMKSVNIISYYILI